MASSINRRSPVTGFVSAFMGAALVDTIVDTSLMVLVVVPTMLTGVFVLFRNGDLPMADPVRDNWLSVKIIGKRPNRLIRELRRRSSTRYLPVALIKGSPSANAPIEEFRVVLDLSDHQETPEVSVGLCAP